MKRKLNLFLGASLIASALTFSADASEIQDENDLALAKTSQSPSSLKRSTPELTDISVLPNEILAHILSFVPASDVAQAAGVCRLWHAAAKQHFIYMPIKIDSLESFNAFYHPDNLKDEDAEAARKKVTHLVIDDSSKSIGNINLKTVLASTPRLRALKLNKTSIVIPTPEKAELQSEETKSQPKITGPEIINLDDCAIIKHQDQQSINVALEEAGRYFASILLTNNRLTEVRIARMNGFFSKQILPQLKSAIAEPTFVDTLGRIQRPLKKFEVLSDGFLETIPAELGLFPNISTLRFIDTKIEDMEDSHPVLGPIQFIPKLELLELSNIYPATLESRTPQPEQQEKIERLLSRFKDATQLKTLKLRATGLQHLDSQMLSPFKTLEALVVDKNPHLTSISSDVYQPSSLKLLDIRHTGIEKVEDSFKNTNLVVKVVDSDIEAPKTTSFYEKIQFAANSVMNKVFGLIFQYHH